MENFWLVDSDNTILDRCTCSSLKEAQQLFDNRGWVTGEVISEADAIIEAQLSAEENQSTEY